MRPRRPRNPLFVFLIVSIAVHLLLIRGFFLSELMQRFFRKTPSSQGPIYVEFLTPTAEERENPEARRMAAVTHRELRETAPRETGEKGRIALADPRAQKNSDTIADVQRIFPDYRDLLKPGAPGTRAPDREDTVSLDTQEFRYLSYFSKVKERIEMNWNYPMLAQIRGEQGELLLRFTIARTGDVERVALLRSSGHSLLDEAAISAVRKASPFPPIPMRLDLDRLNILATFEYILGYRSVR